MIRVAVFEVAVGHGGAVRNSARNHVGPGARAAGSINCAYATRRVLHFTDIADAEGAFRWTERTAVRLTWSMHSKRERSFDVDPLHGGIDSLAALQPTRTQQNTPRPEGRGSLC